LVPSLFDMVEVRNALEGLVVIHVDESRKPLPDLRFQLIADGGHIRFFNDPLERGLEPSRFRLIGLMVNLASAVYLDRQRVCSLPEPRGSGLLDRLERLRRSVVYRFLEAVACGFCWHPDGGTSPRFEPVSGRL